LSLWRDFRTLILMHPIASIQATEMTRRAVRGSGPGDAVPERAPRRARRTAARRPMPGTGPGGAAATTRTGPVRTVNVLDC
jgi:hypothetical protein